MRYNTVKYSVKKALKETMKYIIDRLVVFRTDDGAIWQPGDEDSKVLLSPIVSRLLALLIEEQGKILTRDDIMHRVWSAHGLEASGNSLNQYISQLRKLMSNFGLGDSVINTLPRIGFQLDGSLEIEIVASSAKSQKKLAINSKKNTNKKKLIIVSFTSLLVFLTIAMPYITSKTISHLNVRQNITPPKEIGIVNGCKVYGAGMEMQFYNHAPQAVTQKIFDNYNIQCKENNVAILYIQESVSQGKPGRIFISLCSELNGYLAFCKNKLFNSWQ